MSNLIPLGTGRVFRDPSTGQIVVKKDTLRQDAPIGDDFGGDDDDGFEGADDDFGDDGEIGSLSKEERKAIHKRRQAMHKDHRDDRKDLRSDRRSDRRDHDDSAGHPNDKDKNMGSNWGTASIGNSETLVAAGPTVINVVAEEEFVCEDLTMAGAAGSLLTDVKIGSRSVFTSQHGTDISTFSASAFLRGFLKGQKVKIGQAIKFSVVLPGAGTVSAQIFGKQKQSNCS